MLRECGVVQSERDGKAHVYALDARPLNRIRDGWLAGFSRMQVDSLKALRKRVEAAERRSTSRR